MAYDTKTDYDDYDDYGTKSGIFFQKNTYA